MFFDYSSRLPWAGLKYVIVIFPDHTHLLFEVLEYVFTVLLEIFQELFLSDFLISLKGTLHIYGIRTVFSSAGRFVTSRLVSPLGRRGHLSSRSVK